MTYVFDLDGTLVDTRLAVVKAYEQAGVVMPEWAWGMPWYQWLTDPAAHARKNEVYLHMLEQYAESLPLLQHALKLDALVITGASVAAVTAIKKLWAPNLRVALTEAGLEEKVAFLSQPTMTPGIYVDDDPVVRETVEEETSWRTQSPEQCLQSFSQQAPTPD